MKGCKFRQASDNSRSAGISAQMGSIGIQFPIERKYLIFHEAGTPWNEGKMLSGKRLKFLRDLYVDKSEELGWNTEYIFHAYIIRYFLKVVTSHARLR